MRRLVRVRHCGIVWVDGWTWRRRIRAFSAFSWDSVALVEKLSSKRGISYISDSRELHVLISSALFPSVYPKDLIVPHSFQSPFSFWSGVGVHGELVLFAGMAINFHNKNYARSLAFIMRLKGTRKWP